MHLTFQYGTTRNFCGVPNYTNQKFVVVGVPIDCATSFRSGCRMGPNAIRDASMMLTDGVHPDYPVDLTQFVGDAGDMALPSGYTPDAMAKIRRNIRSFHENHVVSLGGHHGITHAVLQALSQKYDNLAVVHFDAHCDTWDTHFGQSQGHGTWLKDAVEDNLIDARNVISIGIRSPADQASASYLQTRGGTTLTARRASRFTPRAMKEIIQEKVGNKPCYLSLDIDCLDPAYAPGTGTPEIAGLTSMWLKETLEELNQVNWIGMDLVEVSPPYDHSQITSLAAATLVWCYLSMNIHKGLT